MPLYDFKCNCGREIERLQGIFAPAPLCPDCYTPMKKGVGSFGLVLWKSSKAPRPAPITHNSKALSLAATRGWEMEMA